MHREVSRSLAANVDTPDPLRTLGLASCCLDVVLEQDLHQADERDHLEQEVE